MAKRSKKKTRPQEVDRGNSAETKGIVPGKSSSVPWQTIFQALVIAASVLWIYWPALHGDWLWDDDLLVTDNPVVHDPSGLWNIWFEPGNLVDYQPLKVSVVWLQWQLWGNDTLRYHLTNVFLHMLSALLVWRLLSKFGLRLAWLGGLIFAIHPVQVESVAWIAELKNTLSLPPFLWAMCAFIDYEEHGKSKDYFLALGLFLVAMLCKPTMVIFPVVILLYAWWKTGRVGWSDVKASAPFFVVSLALGLVTVWFLHHHTMGEDAIPMGGFFSRLACAGLSLSFYFSKCFLPVGLLPTYPRWVVDPPTLAQFLPWPILLTVIFWFWTKRGSWGRHALLGLGFFLINLAPFVGFSAASYMAFTWVMDHVLYIPIIGLIGLVVAALGRMEMLMPASFRPYSIGLGIVVLALLVFDSRGYAALYVDSKTLWTYEFQHNPEAYTAHNDLGSAFFHKGRLSEAMEQYELALQIKPDYVEEYNNIGVALLESGHVSEAMEQFEQALQIKPDYAEARNNLGSALQQAGRLNEAVEQFDLALKIKPDYASAHINLGLILSQTGHVPEAVEQFKQALQIDPYSAEAHFNWANTLLLAGHALEAMEQYEQALRLKPDYAEASYDLATALLLTHRTTEAIEQYRQALRIKPDYVEVHFNLGIALEQSGQLTEAMEQYEEVLRLKPDFAAARDNLERVQALQNAAPVKN
jgi:tetratricopeptide (TPR) repeat protein